MEHPCQTGCVSYALRQMRARVAEQLEARAKRFTSNQDMWPVRVPRDGPLSLGALVRDALPDVHARFDPLTLRTRTLLHLEWDDGAAWELWVAVLPSGLKLFCDTGADETRVLASGGRHANDDAERLFLQLLSESAGETFGLELSGGAPTRVRTSLRARDLLVDFFVNLLEVSNEEASLRGQLPARPDVRPGPAGHDFREDVERWLDGVLQGAKPLQ